MKPWVLGTLAAVVLIRSASAQEMPRPSSLPDVILDCYRSHSAAIGYPTFRPGVAIDGDNFQTPTVRYRLQVVNRNVLKIINFPDDAMNRKEYGKSIFELNRDFTGKHTIVGWREETSLGIRVLTIDFEQMILSIMQLPEPSTSSSFASSVSRAHVEVNVCKEKKTSREARVLKSLVGLGDTAVTSEPDVARALRA
jgi:hypothetical protein